MRDITWEQYQLVVVLCDIWSEESFIIQYAKNRGIKTATLQHAHFMCGDKDDILKINRYHLTGSQADYFLAWNQYTVEEAEKCGLDTGKFHIVGNPKYCKINIEYDQKRNNNGIVGVMLSRDSYDGNRNLIGITKEFCRQMGMKYKIKYHPSSKGDEYEMLYDDLFLDVVENSISVDAFSENVEFVVMTSSSTFVDLIYLNRTVYKMSTSYGDTLAGISDATFNDSKTLIDMYTTDKREVVYPKRLQNIRDYLIPKVGFGELYNVFLGDILY